MMIFYMKTSMAVTGDPFNASLKKKIQECGQHSQPDKAQTASETVQAITNNDSDSPSCFLHLRKCRHSQQKRKKTMTPAQKIHLSSRARRSIMRIVSPDRPSVLAAE